MQQQKKPDDQSYQTYISFANSLMTLFDADPKRYDPKIKAAWPYLMHIPATAWHPMIKICVDTWDTWPRNWAKNVKEAYTLWSGDNKFGRKQNYDKHDDPRYPVEDMRKAFTLLSEKGRKAYLDFCAATGMPKTDMDRVETKWKVCNGELTLDMNRIKVRIAGVPKTKRPQIDHDKRWQELEAQRELILSEPIAEEEPPF